MWQAHYFIYQMRMRQLVDEADRRRRWQVEDDENGRAPDDTADVRAALAATPGRGRRLAIRAIAQVGAWARLTGRAGSVGATGDIHAPEPSSGRGHAEDGTLGPDWTRRHAA